MYVRIILIIFITWGTFTLNAQQQVVATAGNFYSNSTGSISWTLGELAIETYTTPNNILTQGFQQGRLLITTVHEIPQLNFQISVHPNPANDHLFIKTNSEEFVQMYYVIYDLTGKIVLQDKIRENETSVSVSHLKPSIYLLRVFEEGKGLKTFKIIKQ